MKTGLVLCARNEEHIIEEWIAHHVALGFDHVAIFDNMSTDATPARIEGMARAFPHVAMVPWPLAEHAQVSAFNEGLARMRHLDVDWCAFLDTDEFLAPDGRDDLQAFLGRHREHAAIAMHWAVFGSAQHRTRMDGLIQEQFLYRARAEFGPNRHIKSFVRPALASGAFGPHGFKVEGDYYTAGGDKAVWKLPYAYTENPAELNGWRVNHYFCQWRERWDAKVERSRLRGPGAVPRTEEHWTHHDRNEVFDPSALRWTPTDRAILNLAKAAP